jgi:hypothetical protein
MGMVGSASHFQMNIATVVLAGLIYLTCESYIDDVIVFGRTSEEFITRLRDVFERFRKYNVILNPDKCRFGVSEVEYLGHHISEHGMTFSREKLAEVFQIPLPKNGKDLKSFLGLVSYFRDHIRHLASMTRPLLEVAKRYEKSRVIKWTPEAIDAFETIKRAINDCPVLFFIDDDSPVFLHTDASDYGIGAYLFQIINGKERPIAFMSRALNVTEIKWSTIEKECFAMVQALRKFEYLLRDRSFTWRTDHKNLLHMHDPPSAKVQRWKFFIQQFDATVEYIKGKDNVVADALSRLLPIPEEEMNLMKEFDLTDHARTIIPQFHNSIVGHHGVERTYAKLQKAGHNWEYMREHVKRFRRDCPCCQKMSYIKVPIHTYAFTLAALSPMERLYIDTLSFSSKDEFGNQHVIVIIDAFTRWLELEAVGDLSAITAAKVLLRHIGRFGVPSQLTSDMGSQFINETCEQLFKLSGIEHLKTVPHSKEENGIVERSNKEIVRHTRNIMFDKEIVDKKVEWGVYGSCSGSIH